MTFSIKECADFLLQNDHFAILCHQNPDGDTLGSGYALCRALRNMGKKANVLCHNEIPQKFFFLKEGLQPQDFAVKTVVSVDVASGQLLGESLLPYLGRIDLAIDHHGTHDLKADKECVDPQAAANCEIIYLILCHMGINITREIANCLYTGISTDTGCFCYSNVTIRTHRIAADLLELSCDHYQINHEMFESKTPSMLLMEKLALENLQYDCGGRIALMAITSDMMAKTGISETELDFITSLPKKIKGVDIGVVLKQRGEKEFKVSLRTSEAVDASEICRQFGGGGHKRAAGCSVSGSKEQAAELLLPALRKALEKNND